MHRGRWTNGFGCWIIQIKSKPSKKQRHNVGLTALSDELGKLIFVLREVIFFSFFVLDKANPRIA
jgi:hypothetical protein